MRNLFAAFAVFGLALWSGEAAAQMMIKSHTVAALNMCGDSKIYSAASRDAPEEIARSFAGKGAALTFRTCQDADDNVHTFIRKPRPNRGGVCRVAEDEVFPGKKGDFVIVDLLYDGTAPGWYFDLPGWDGIAPAAWRKMGYRARHTSLALVTSEVAACPPTDDPRYIQVAATDGILKTFFRLWRAATATQEDFDKVFAAVPVLPVMSYPPNPAWVRNGFRSAVFAGHEEVWDVACDPSEISPQSGCAARVGAYSIYFDVTENGLAVTGIRENPVM